MELAYLFSSSGSDGAAGFVLFVVIIGAIVLFTASYNRRQVDRLARGIRSETTPARGGGGGALLGVIVLIVIIALLASE